MDMNNDGSVDLAVGSLGAVVLLWSVFHPSVHPEKKKNLHAHTIKVCPSFSNPLTPQVTERRQDLHHGQVRAQ